MVSGSSRNKLNPCTQHWTWAPKACQILKPDCFIEIAQYPKYSQNHISIPTVLFYTFLFLFQNLPKSKIFTRCCLFRLSRTHLYFAENNRNPLETSEILTLFDSAKKTDFFLWSQGAQSTGGSRLIQIRTIPIPSIPSPMEITWRSLIC